MLEIAVSRAYFFACLALTAERCLLLNFPPIKIGMEASIFAPIDDFIAEPVLEVRLPDIIGLVFLRVALMS